MQTKAEKGNCAEAVLYTLNYFHIFKHPLTIEEIHRFLGTEIQSIDLLKVLFDLVDSGMIYCSNGYYTLEDDNKLIERRLEGQERANKLMKKALASANRVASFPFVAGVCISGSLSKGYANEKSDIDLFIITTPNRLWIARSILHFYKKLTFIWQDQHSYCMNYFIDESKLCIEEQNVFTATELTTLIPVYNLPVYQELINANKHWLTKTYPNNNWDSANTSLNDKQDNRLKHLSQFVLNLLFAKQLNIVMMKITDNWWRFKWKKKGFPMEEYDLAMKTKWYVSKNHPLNYQKKVLTKLAPKSSAKAAAIL